jgi:tetratricopeptide (TPR) repeat protein
VLDAMLNLSMLQGDLSAVPALLLEAQRVDKPTAELRNTLASTRTLLLRRERLSKELPAPAGQETAWTRALDAFACAEQGCLSGQPQAQVEALLAKALTKSVELGPALGLRARLLLERGKLTAALAEAERAVRLCPNNAHGFLVRGRVRLERGTPGALEDLTKAAELSAKTDSGILQALADALFQAGRVTQAIAAQRAALKLKPQDQEMIEQLGRFEKAGTPGGAQN